MSEIKPKKPIYKRWWFWALVLFVLIPVLSGGTDPTGEEAVADSSSTETPIETDSKFIPGITAADVKLNFTDKGFTCGEPRVTDDEDLGYFVFYSCELKTDEYEYRVEFDGESVTDILSVQGIVLNYGQRSLKEVASEFLGYVATLPYDGSNPEEAKVWAQSNIGMKSETEIGEVKFDSSGTERSAILTISR